MVVRRRTIEVVLVVLALAASSCGTASASPKPAPGVMSSSSTVAPPATSTSTSTTTTTSTTVPPTTTTIPHPNETLTATARPSVSSLVAYDAPNGDPVALPFHVPNPHQFGGPLTLMVTEGSKGDPWLKVQLPVRPNGQEAWIPAEDYYIGSTRVHAEVDLTTTSVRVYDDEELIAETQAAIGTEATPTPVGTFFIAAKRLNPPKEAYLGTWSLVLSGFSETLASFAGGLPVIAIHGTNYPESELGESISNGCVRVPDDVIQFLARHVPLGAPVVISA